MIVKWSFRTILSLGITLVLIFLVCVTQSANYVDIGYRGNAVCGSRDYEQVFNDDKHLVRHMETTRSWCSSGCVVLFSCPPDMYGRQSNSVI